MRAGRLTLPVSTNLLYRVHAVCNVRRNPRQARRWGNAVTLRAHTCDSLGTSLYPALLNEHFLYRPQGFLLQCLMACSFNLPTPSALKEWMGAEAAKKIIETAWEKNVIRLVQDNKAQKGSSIYPGPELLRTDQTIARMNTDGLLRKFDRNFGSGEAQAQACNYY